MKNILWIESMTTPQPYKNMVLINNENKSLVEPNIYEYGVEAFTCHHVGNCHE